MASASNKQSSPEWKSKNWILKDKAKSDSSPFSSSSSASSSSSMSGSQNNGQDHRSLSEAPLGRGAGKSHQVALPSMKSLTQSKRVSNRDTSHVNGSSGSLSSSFSSFSASSSLDVFGRSRQTDSSEGSSSMFASPSPELSSSVNRLLIENSESCKSRGSESISERGFVTYLAQDEQGIDVAETQEVVDLLNTELASLLRLKFRDFWKQVASNRSLQVFLDSYLHFRGRWYDLPLCKQPGAGEGVIVGDGDLSRRVFMILYRMSSNQDPGAMNNESLSLEEHSDIICKHKLLDVTKLMDICALYGHNNPELTRKLVSNAMKVQHDSQRQIVEIVPQVVSILTKVHHRCSGALKSIIDPGNKGTKNEKLYQELYEVNVYLHDVTATLDAFILAYPPAASIFIDASLKAPQGNLLSSMAALHDFFLPILCDGLSALARLGGIKDQSSFLSNLKSGDASLPSEMHLKRLELRIVKFAWDLLYFSFLTSQVNQDEDVAAATDYPIERGTQLVQAIVSLAAGEAGKPTSLTEIQSLKSSSSLPDAKRNFLLRNIQERYHLFEEISGLHEKGSIQLDETQYDYLLSLLADRNPQFAEESEDLSSISKSTIEYHDEKDEQAVIHQSQISQVKDLFPEYGDGFIAACLEVYDNDPEMVIQKILEGTLHADLLALDPKLAKSSTKRSAVPGKRDKGKGKSFEEDFAQLKSEGEWKHESSSNFHTAPSMPFASEKKTSFAETVPSEVNSNVIGRFVRREKGDPNALKFLDERDGTASSLTAALASRFAYEDEYDDSFDDLDMHIADAGVEETETLVDLVSRNNQRSRNEDDRSARQINRDIGTVRGMVGNERLGGSFARNISQNAPKDFTKVFQKGGAGWDRSSSAQSTISASTGSKQFGRGKYKGKAKDQHTSRFYIKDGKNYSYKVAGAVAAVSSAEEAEALKKVEEETIHGLGAGGNVPHRVAAITSKDNNSSLDNAGNLGKESVGPGNAPSRPSRGYGRGADTRSSANNAHQNYNRKDRAFKKHMYGLGGY